MNTNESPTTKGRGLLSLFKERIHYIFDLEGDKENERHTIEAIKEDVDFRGSKMWILIGAILIASLGLNVNSTAVIIGAMLISPLMGPIIGFGLGLGIYDFELIKKSLRNLGLMTLISIITAALYFLISPLSQAQSELLARTQPTTYDVLIAFVGGAAGIVASSTRHKGNVITGVAIATALMPPLCTAGFGLATGNMSFFFGAFYLYLINSVFIGLATLIMVRVLKFPYKSFVDPEREKRIRRLVIVIAICTIIPSLYFGWQLISQNMAEVGAHRFVQERLSNPTNQVIKEGLTMNRGKGRLEVVLLGRELDSAYLDSVKALMPSYGLSDVELVVRQGFGAKHTDDMDMNQIKSVLLQDLYENSDKIIREQSRQIDSLQRQLRHYERYSTMLPDVQREARSLFSDIGRISFAPEVREGMSADSTLIVIVDSGKLSASEEAKLQSWLMQRTKVKDVRLLMPNRP